LKVFWGADDGNLTGSRRFFAKVGTVMAVHAAFATLLAAKAPTANSTSAPSPKPSPNTRRPHNVYNATGSIRNSGCRGIRSVAVVS